MQLFLAFNTFRKPRPKSQVIWIIRWTRFSSFSFRLTLWKNDWSFLNRQVQTSTNNSLNYAYPKITNNSQVKLISLSSEKDLTMMHSSHPTLAIKSLSFNILSKCITILFNNIIVLDIFNGSLTGLKWSKSKSVRGPYYFL